MSDIDFMKLLRHKTIVSRIKIQNDRGCYVFNLFDTGKISYEIFDLLVSFLGTVKGDRE